jgi:hypothetical protein
MASLLSSPTYISDQLEPWLFGCMSPVLSYHFLSFDNGLSDSDPLDFLIGADL